VLLGWGFIALAYVVSVRVSEKPVAAGLALAIWFFFVLIFDLMLLGTLVASEGKFNAELLPWLLMLNPTDIYRLLNIVAFDGAAQLSGVLSLGSDLPFGAAGLWLGLVLWFVVPLGGALLLFRNRRI
jgi:Cu-processing system permease protein